ncbi:GspH/FimT family pseudopilin [Chromatocurvus halotolerans]|uniref:Type II secretion system protein H n=1 Tax=Chromatocurvus halotolerans TaxID=1132028 RepID=A0A4R2KY56_9GAMM|nr:GspH/FimT family pseudopilin [Chromatocurvus halotolerans]TCO76309.1 type IV fimbrial biogenesis protein FimT [Chromatocurvus halotolerans]
MAEHPYRRSHGFTMIELMVTLVVLGILLGVGIPSFNAIMLNSRTSGVANDLTSAINLARSEAVKRAAPVRVCPSSNPLDTTPTCSGTWSDGWIVSVDVPVGGEPPVRRTWRPPFPGADFAQTSGANQPIIFGPLGQLVSGRVDITIEVDGCRGRRARLLEIAATGRVSVERVLCSADST